MIERGCARNAASLVPAVVGTALSLLVGGCVGASWDGAAAPTGSLDPDVPQWRAGQWWRYDGSDGNTYTYRVEGTETKEGFETYHVSVQLGHADGFGVSRYDYWYDLEGFGYVASEKGPMYSQSTCAYAALFPLDDSGTHPCEIRIYRDGSLVDRSDASWSKRHAGVKSVRVPGGEYSAHELTFEDVTGSTGTVWYAPQAQWLVKEVGVDGITYQLSDWEK